MNTNDAVFAEKLTQMLISAKGHKNVLSYTEIGEFFKGIPFTAEDAEKTIEFLEANGVDVLKMEDSQNDDEVLLIPIGGKWYYIADIGLRMLTPRELFKAQGFPEDYIIDVDADGKPYPKYEQVARCGNAVCPPIPAALVRANLPEMCGKQ